MRKLAIAAVSTALMSTALTAGKFEGFNVGLQVGAGSASSRTDGSLYGLETNTTLMNSRADLASKGAIGGIHAGWNRVFQNRWLAGVEAFVDASGVSGNSRLTFDDAFDLGGGTNRHFRGKANMDFTVGLGANFGVVFDNALAYVNLGWAGSNWKLRNSIDPSVFGSTVNFNKNKFLSGFRVAYGMSTMLNDNVKLGAEVGYTWYEKVAASRTVVAPAGNSLVAVNRSYRVSARAKPEMLEGKLKLTWQINRGAPAA